MKLGLSIKIDVKKIDKDRLFSGSKGTYLDLTTFIDTAELDKYGNNGFISQSVSTEERGAKVQTPILGNIKVFYNDSADAPHQNHQNTAQPPQNVQYGGSAGQTPDPGFDDSDGIPF